MPLQFVRNDITTMEVDAIVNAANSSLLGGGGVDGAIHRAAGPELLEQCRKLGGCRTGEARITPGYRLPARYVIHTVGPVWAGGANGEAGLLASCYRTSLHLALGAGCESVAFPMISTGAYGYPKEEALKIAVREITAFLSENEMTVYLVVFGSDSLAVPGNTLDEIHSFIDRVYVDESPAFRAEAVRPAYPSYQAASFPSNGMGADASEKKEKKKRALFSSRKTKKAAAALPQVPAPAPSEDESLEEMLRKMDDSFPVVLLQWIDRKHMTDAECYRRANIDRRLFNKIKNVPGYRPGKLTVLAFAVALELTLEETRDMLERAGYSLTRTSKTDIVLEYCILHKIYDIAEINEYLFALDLQPLGNVLS